MYLRMKKSLLISVVALLLSFAGTSISLAAVTITYVNLGGGGNALLRVPSPLGSSPRDQIGIFVMHPGSSYINNRICTELADRGYRTLCADNPFSFNGNGYKGYEDHADIIRRGINCLKGQIPAGQTSSPCTAITGIMKTVIIGHSMAGPMMSFYQNIAENGAAACKKPERLIPCEDTNLSNLPAADGVVLLDSHLGEALAKMTYTDPAVIREQQPDLRDSRVDMFDPANGYNLTTNSATYSDNFRKVFLAGQSRRHNKLIDDALEQLSDITNEQRNVYPDDMPFVVPGSNGARLWQ